MPTNPGRSREEQGGRPQGQERRGGMGKPAVKLPASFRLTAPCTSLPAPPRVSSSSQKTSSCSFSASLLQRGPLHTASCRRLGQVSRPTAGWRGAQHSLGEGQQQPRVARGSSERWRLQVFVVPASEMRRARVSNPSAGRPSVTQGPLPGAMCQCCQPSCSTIATGIRKNSHFPFSKKSKKSLPHQEK